MKLTVKIIMLSAMAAGMLQSCNSERKTPSGITYELVREGDGKMPEEGEHALFNMVYGVADSVWQDTAESYPVIIQKNDSLWTNGGIHEIFNEMKLGDSVTFTVDTETLFTKTWRREIPPMIDPESEFFFQISLDSVMNDSEFATYQQVLFDKERQRQAAEAEAQLEKEKELLAQYFQENNLEPQVSESGLHYIITEKGSGVDANPLDTVSVRYKGYLLNGEVFDTNMEDVARETGRYQEGAEYAPYDVVIGRTSVIRGWHEGLDSLSEGDKATLFIPSKLGYGPNGYQMIPPNTVLLFDVELVDVKK